MQSERPGAVKRQARLRNGSVLCLATALLMAALGAQRAAAQTYSYQRSITISHSNVANTDQSNFPALVAGTYSYLATTANGGKVQNANGYDIIFTTDVAGTNKLDHEIESYNPATGTIAFWVRIPTLSHTTDTVIYMQYGNSTITTSQENRTGVWDSNYEGVWHLNDGGNAAVDDSTVNAANATNFNVSAATGQIAGAASLNGTTSYAIQSSASAGNVAGDITVSFWMNPSSLANSFALVHKGKQYTIAVFPDGIAWADSSNYSYANFGHTNIGIQTGVWQHIVATKKNGTVDIYRDGALALSRSFGSAITQGTLPLTFGAYNDGTPDPDFPGLLDEIRVSSIARSADWIATEYNNQNSPSTFYSVGAENAPVITALSPSSGVVGTSVTISGSGFGGSTGTVTFNGVAATTSSWSDTSISATVPSGVSSGAVVVTNSAGVQSNGVAFSLSLIISSLSPASGATGSSVTIAGSNFGSAAGTVTFNGQTAATTAWSNSSITAVVPANASGACAVVVSNGGLQSNGALFVVPVATPLYSSAVSVSVGVSTGTASPVSVMIGVVTGSRKGASAGDAYGHSVSVLVGPPSASLMTSMVSVGIGPSISGLSASSGPIGSTLTINGAGFGNAQGTSSVTVNGASASPTSWSSSSITVSVPAAAAVQGNVQVTADLTASNAVPFTVTPAITSLNPTSGEPGSTVTITGSSFGTTQGSGSVQFNGTTATILGWSNAGITVQVPVGATTGNVVVTNTTGLQSNPELFTVADNLAIINFSPSFGPVGTSVTIEGGGFGSTQGSSALAFNGTLAAITSWNDNEIVATVPPGSSTGPVTVTLGGGTMAWSASPFVVSTTVQVTDSLGNNSSYTSTVLGGTWQNTAATGSGCSSCTVRGAIENTFDSNGNLLTYTDELGHITTYTYDGNNNLASQSIPLNTTTTVTTSYTYNSFGEVLTMTDPLSNVTTNTYDSNGNLLSVTTPAPNGNTAASVTQFAYNSLGELTQITDPLSNVTTLTYTAAGLIGTITDAQSNVTTYQYDTHGNRTAIIDALQHTTSFAYDSMDRLTMITYPDTSTASFGYDYRGRRTSVTDQNGKTTTYAYDDADRLTSVTDAASHVAQYSYDTENNLLSITDANNNATSFAYDAFGRVTKTTFPSTLAETYTYDANSNLSSKTDRKSQAILYVYDALNRLTSKEYPDSTTVDYVYDLAGKIKQVTDPGGSYGFAYDNMGRLIGTTTQYTFLPSVTFANSYGYDAASNRTSFTAPDGSTNTYQYDTLNRLSTLTSSLTGQFSYSYDALSRRTALNRPNGVGTSYSYDSLSRLLSVLHQAGGSTVDGASYTYDNAGNRTSKLNQLNNITENYTYDAIYQLLQVTQGATTTESYTYDPVGNRLTALTVPQWNYNSSNELTSTSAATFSYDNDGNTVSKTVSGNTTQYTWDFENRMTSAVMPETGGTAVFQYDPFGRRIQKAFTQSSTTTTTIYVYDGANDIEEVDQNGNVLARYTQGASIDEPLAELRSGTSAYYEQDGLGSVTSLSGSTGSVANTYVYKPFGNIASSTGSFVNPFQFTGRDYDAETGLRYYRARYYDSNIGRFISEDPIGFDGDTNFYTYVGNSAGDWADPEGLRKVKICRQRLKTFFVSWFFNHTYIAITDDNGQVLVDPLDNLPETYGILGNLHSRKNQIPRKGDPRNDGKDCMTATNKGPGSCEDKIDKLKNALDQSVEDQTCPSCGDNYRAWIATDLLHFFDGYNSNTYTFNMVSGAGLNPPPEPRSPGYHPAPGGWYPP